LGFTIRFFTYAQLINLFEEIFIFQVYKFRSPDPAPFIIDGGSNIGLSVLYFKKIYPASWIIAFEPDKETFTLLKENIKRNNLQQVSAFNFALQDKEGEMVLHKKLNSPGSLTMSLISSSAKLQTEVVHARKLSDYIPGTVAMMKLDVEGSEVSIINDLIQTQKIEFIERMIIEYHPSVTKLSIEEFASRIRKCNFSCRYSKDEIHPNATEVMLHCVNKDYTRQTR
jgi:FkbM family methyltransferase